jgi:Ser/Thr protein kinase RdoA (MazF antagonist)
MAKEYQLPEPEGVWRLPRPEATGLAFLLLCGGARYVLRLWRTRDPARIALVEVCKNFAVDHGLPGPVSLKTREDRVFCSRAHRLATVFPHVVGEGFRGDEESLQAAARLQAQFHQVMKIFPLSASLGNGVPPLGSMEAENLMAAMRSGPAPFDREAEEAWQDAASPWPWPEPDYEALPRQAGHFDWSPHNLLFRPGKPEVMALLDYDRVAERERALDLALGMARFSRAFAAKSAGGSNAGSEFRKACRIYLRAYHACEPLRREEIAAIPYLLYCQAQRNIRSILDVHYGHGDFSLDSDLGEQRILLREALAVGSAV